MTTRRPTRAAGSTRCPGCDKRFTDDPRPTTTVPGTERGGGRPGYSAYGPHGHDRPVDIRWHAECLTDFQAQNAAYREQTRLDRRNLVEQIATAGGLDVAAVLAEFDARNPRGTEQ